MFVYTLQRQCERTQLQGPSCMVVPCLALCASLDRLDAELLGAPLASPVADSCRDTWDIGSVSILSFAVPSFVIPSFAMLKRPMTHTEELSGIHVKLLWTFELEAIRAYAAKMFCHWQHWSQTADCCMLLSLPCCYWGGVASALVLGLGPLRRCTQLEGVLGCLTLLYMTQQTAWECFCLCQAFALPHSLLRPGAYLWPCKVGALST